MSGALLLSDSFTASTPREQEECMISGQQAIVSQPVFWARRSSHARALIVRLAIFGFDAVKSSEACERTNFW
jgi:hypothetical protein